MVKVIKNSMESSLTNPLDWISGVVPVGWMLINGDMNQYLDDHAMIHISRMHEMTDHEMR